MSYKKTIHQAEQGAGRHTPRDGGSYIFRIRCEDRSDCYGGQSDKRTNGKVYAAGHDHKGHA